jgi:hypothetical protein
MPKTSATATVRFAMTKGEGDFPSGEEFSKKEKKDPSVFTKFYLAWDDELAESMRFTRSLIKECIVIYDGVSHTNSSKFGLYFEDEELCGYPSPIIEFRLSKAVNPDSFVKCIWTSSVIVQPLSRARSGADPFIFEDHNGYTTALNQKEIDAFHHELVSEGLFSGKSFDLEKMEGGLLCLEMGPRS